MYIPLKPLVSFKICFRIFSVSRFSKIYTGFNPNSLIIVFNISSFDPGPAPRVWTEGEQVSRLLLKEGIVLYLLLLILFQRYIDLLFNLLYFIFLIFPTGYLNTLLFRVLHVPKFCVV